MLPASQSYKNLTGIGSLQAHFLFETSESLDHYNIFVILVATVDLETFVVHKIKFQTDLIL